MGTPVAFLRDDFADSLVAAAWDAVATGSATVAETSGQARFTLPSSTAGTHIARYTSSETYDVTNDWFFINIGTMVATGVAATAFYQFYIDATNALQWIQVSGTIYCRKIVAGVTTDLFSASWSGTTYKYLAIGESAGTITWWSSTNGTSWTSRTTLPNPFAVTDLFIDFGATCGNVASPGSFRLDDAHLILPALTTNWRWTQVVWPFDERTETVTAAIDTAGTVQGYLVTADGVDVNNEPSGNVRYWSGPMNGGRVLTEQATQAAAQAMAVNFPLDGRIDLEEMVEGHCYRIYHRSIDGSAYTLRELFPQRTIYADMIKAGVIQALHIRAGSITADRLDVTELSAITANIGQLIIDTDGYLWQGTGTASSPTTGLKIFNSSGVGKLSTYNGGVEQVTFDTDGVLKAAAGNITLDANGIRVIVATTEQATRAYTFYGTGAFSTLLAAIYAFTNGVDTVNARIKTERVSSFDTNVYIEARSAGIGTLYLIAESDSGTSAHTVFLNSAAFSVGKVLNVDDVIKVNGTQVVGTRKTGWAMPTGAVSRATYAPSTVTLSELAQRLSALLIDLNAHGIIGS